MLCVEVCVAAELRAEAALLSGPSGRLRGGVSLVCLWAGVNVGVAREGGFSGCQMTCSCMLQVRTAGVTPPPVAHATPDGGRGAPQSCHEGRDRIDSLGNKCMQSCEHYIPRVAVLVCVLVLVPERHSVGDACEVITTVRHGAAVSVSPQGRCEQGF